MTFQNRLDIWISAWIGLAGNVVSIITLTFWYPSWEFKWIAYLTKKQMIKRKEKNEVV